MNNQRLYQDLLARRHVSPGQPFVVVHVSQRVGALMAALALRLGLTPNHLTICGLGLMLLGCLPYAWGTPAGWMVAAVLWQLGFACDCADGQLARATRGGSAFGGWLDAACDYIRQTALTLTLAYTLIVSGLPLVLVLLACGLLQSGFSVYLHSAIEANKVELPEGLKQGARPFIKQVMKNLLDTPVYLVVLCLLAPWPALLMVYIAGYGGLLLLRGWIIAIERFQQGEPR